MGLVLTILMAIWLLSLQAKVAQPLPQCDPCPRVR
jgi:hypothetical protein